MCVRTSKSGMKIISSMSNRIHNQTPLVLRQYSITIVRDTTMPGLKICCPPTPAHVQVNMQENIYARIRFKLKIYILMKTCSDTFKFCIHLSERIFQYRHNTVYPNILFALFVPSNVNLK
jgi:hypothetical protein